MEKIIKVASSLPRNKREDSFVDRLSNRYSVLILVIFAVAISITSWVGKPLHCWFPKYITKYQRRYGHSYCWVANTYYLPYADYIPREHEDDKRRVIKYYQWIPWILLAQALLFWLPSIVWKQLNSKAGIDSSDVMASARALQNTSQLERRDARLKLIGSMFDRFLRARKLHSSGDLDCCDSFLKCCMCRCSGRRVDCYLVVLFLVSKLFYIGNILFQVFALSAILNVDYQAFPKEYFEFYHGNKTGEYYHNSPVFPRLSMCDITMRVLGNVHRHTVQCILPLNFYVEKMYLFLWFWIVFLMVASVYDFLLWFFRAVLRSDRLNFVKNHLASSGLLPEETDQRQVEQFLNNYLKQDGSLLLRLIAHNTNSLTTSDVIATLWGNWIEHEKTSDDEGTDGVVDDTLPLTSRGEHTDLSPQSPVAKKRQTHGSYQV